MSADIERLLTRANRAERQCEEAMALLVRARMFLVDKDDYPVRNARTLVRRIDALRKASS